MNDNVKKVFEMLGVEPNEEFKIIDHDSIYYITDDLFLGTDKDEDEDDLYIQDLICGNWEIIKLPKEPTFQELMNWKPKLNEDYHFVDDTLNVYNYFYQNLNFENDYIKSFKPYPTKEMAQRRKEVQEKYRELGHTFTIEEWQNQRIEKHSLFIDHNNKIVSGSCYNFSQGVKYTFSTAENREKFIEFLGSTQQEQYENACLYL